MAAARAKVTKEQYTEAMTTIATAEKDVMTEARVHVETARDALKTAREEMQKVYSALPVVAGPPSTARANMESWMSQMASFESQASYTLQALDGQMALYAVEPATPPPPVTTP